MSDRDDPTPTLDYASPPPAEARSEPPRFATLCWCSAPALVGAAAIGVALVQIANAPATPELSASLVGAIVACMLISLLTSGALVLAVFESRKSMASVAALALNLGWFIACAGWFFLVRFKAR